MPPNRFESEVESFLEGSHGDRTHIKRADHPRLHHYAGHYCLMWVRARKSLPYVLTMVKNSRLMASWASIFAETRLEGPYWSSIFADQQSWDTAGRVCCAEVLLDWPAYWQC